MTLDVIVSDRGEEMISEESEPRVMKEGDYLRQRVVLDDISDDDDADVESHEDVKRKSGCLPRPASAPAAHRHDSETHHSKRLAEKLFKWFRPPASHHAASGRHSPPCRGTARHRRFMRVVKDEQAPPPERVGDNPNIICRYSQEYLTRHYAELARRGHLSDSSSQPGAAGCLPYTTSGHTILKKSSTDPTSDHSAVPTLKHATFCDVVTVVDSDAGDIHEELLRESDASDELDSAEGSPPSQSGFFLSQADPESGPADEVDRSVPEPCPAVQQDDVVEEEVMKDVCNSVGLMNIFSTAATMELEPEVSTQSPDEPKRKTSGSLPTTKHVKLVELMAQIRADDGERS